MLEVRQLSKSFPLPRRAPWVRREPDPRERDGRLLALHPVSFTAAPGRVLGILGPNGAGKTTLLRLLATSLQPTSGTAVFEGIDIVRSPSQLRGRLGFLSGATGLYGRLTPIEVLEYFGRLHRMTQPRLQARIETLVEALDMGRYRHRRCDTLSTGMKQKVSIARTLVHEPQLVVFDEPTTGLDVAAAEAILRLVEQCRQEGKTVLLSTHHMHEVERVCDSVVVLSDGRLGFTGTPDELLERTGSTRLDEAFLRIVNTKEARDAA